MVSELVLRNISFNLAGTAVCSFVLSCVKCWCNAVQQVQWPLPKSQHLEQTKAPKLLQLRKKEQKVLMRNPRTHGVFLEETGVGCFIYQKTFQHGPRYQSAWQHLQQLFEVVPAAELGYLWAKAAATPAFSTYSVGWTICSQCNPVWVGFCVVLYRVGARNSSAILHCSRQVNRWPRYSVISWCGHQLEKIKENYYLVWASSAVPIQSEQSSCQDTLKSKAHPTPTEVNSISATQKESKPHSVIFTTIPWPPPYGERRKAPLGGGEPPPRIPASVGLLKGGIYFN